MAEKASTLLARFLEREPQASLEVEHLISKVVHFDGYFIPASERRDVIQEALLGVWREAARPGFRVRQGFQAFVRSIAYRRCVDWMRRHPRQDDALSSDPIDCGRPDEVVMTREREEMKKRVLSKLTHSHRELIRMRVEMDLGYREIARFQGRSEDAVRRQWCDCLKEAGDIRRRLDGGRPGGEGNER